MQYFDQILPSLQSLGVWAYWIVGLVCLLEAFFLTGLFVPGALAIVTGGILAQQGSIDFFDMAWFVALGSAIGGEASYYLGRATARGLKSRSVKDPSRHGERAKQLLQRYGGFAMVLGRFLGPVSGFVALSAALAGMAPRRFTLWNIASAAAQSLSLLSAGYFFGDALNTLGAGATRLALFAVAVLVLLVVLWILVTRIWRSLPFLKSLVGSIARAIRETPEIAAWSARHPRLSSWIARRLDPAPFSGLTATVLAATFGYFLVLFAGLALDVTGDGQIVALDQRLASLLYAFRDDNLIRFFTAITAIGDKKTIIVLLVTLSGALWVAHKRDLLPGLWVGILSSAATVALLKNLFARTRPELGYFTETSFSFPSGHAASSVASLAMMIFVLWRARWLGALSASIAAVTLVFLIGLSRVYLIEHYLSDVLAGYLIGAMWSIIAIAIILWEDRRHLPAPPPLERNRRLALAALAVLALSASGYLTFSYTKARNPAPAITTLRIAPDIPALFSSGALPAMSETILGARQVPIAIIIEAPDAQAFEAAMAKAGWLKASQPRFSTLARAAWAAWTNQPDRKAPVTPSFWNAQPNDWGFQKPTPEQSLRKRHHARFWLAPFRTAAGEVIIVGTASFDDGLKWGITHHIDANIDAERDTLVADLLKSGALKERERFQMVPPRLGQNFTGDLWFTDGKASVLSPPP